VFEARHTSAELYTLRLGSGHSLWTCPPPGHILRRKAPLNNFPSLLTWCGTFPLPLLTIAGIPLYLLKRLQSVMNSAARLVCSSSRYEHIIPLLRQLHWLKAAGRIDYKLALLVYKCRQGVAPPYLADELRQPADTEARCRLRSASTSSLIVRRTRLSTVFDRAFPVAAPRIWNSLPQHVTSAPSLAIFRSRLKTHLFRCCFPWLHRSLVVPEK